MEQSKFELQNYDDLDQIVWAQPYSNACEYVQQNPQEFYSQPLPAKGRGRIPKQLNQLQKLSNDQLKTLGEKYGLKKGLNRVSHHNQKTMLNSLQQINQFLSHNKLPQYIKHNLK